MIVYNIYRAPTRKPITSFLDLGNLDTPSPNTIDDYECSVEILSIDHLSGVDGKYFNFDLKNVECVLGTALNDGDDGNIYNVFYSGCNCIRNVKMWNTANGGSIGDGHGRIESGTAKQGDWEVGEFIAFTESMACGCPSIDDYECSFEILSNDHSYNDDTGGKYFNFDVAHVECVLGTALNDGGNYDVFYSGCNCIRNVIMWINQDTGSIGDGAGRIDPYDDMNPYDWEVGEYIAFTEGMACGCQSIDDYECSFEILSNDHSADWSVDGQYFNYNLEYAQCILGKTITHGDKFNVFYSGCNCIKSVVLFTDQTYTRSIGDAHGRIDPHQDLGEFWIKGESIAFDGVDMACGCQTIDDYECSFEILSVDHSDTEGIDGQYFNFNTKDVECILGTSLKYGDVHDVFYSGCNCIRTVKMWNTTNGGSIGDGHGRIESGTAKQGDWQVGEYIAFSGAYTVCGCQSGN